MMTMSDSGKHDSPKYFVLAFLRCRSDMAHQIQLDSLHVIVSAPHPEFLIGNLQIIDCLKNLFIYNKFLIIGFLPYKKSSSFNKNAFMFFLQVSCWSNEFRWAW